MVANLVIPLVPGASGFGNILLAEDRYLFLDHGSMPNFVFENKNGKWTRVSNQLDNRGWYSALYNKKDQTYWVGEQNALVHYNKEFRVIKDYGTEDGYNAPMLNMQFDNYGNLWFANMSNQIGRVNTATGSFSTLSETDGYQNMYWAMLLTWFYIMVKAMRSFFLIFPEQELQFQFHQRWAAIRMRRWY